MGRGGKNHDDAPTDEAKQALPTDLEGPPPALLEKTIISFHDESTFQCNDDQPIHFGALKVLTSLSQSQGDQV